MKEMIGGVRLNYEYNIDSDDNRDGDFEEQLLEIVRTEADFERYLLNQNDARLLYHLSPIRQNVLRWFDFDKEASLLEIGAECGAMTEFFCEAVGQVVATEPSKIASIINATRNKNQENLDIYVGRFQDIELEQKFDYITLVGMREESSLMELLKKAKSMLKPGGRLLLALENKYGLKYWAGAPEDETGELFAGIMGKKENGTSVFSKGGLKKLLEKAGFKKSSFYYPVPDYKMPTEIYSEKHLPKAGDIKIISPAYDRPRYEFFDERLAYSSICEDGLFEQFANSFIVVSE